MTKQEVLDALGVSEPQGKTHCPAHEDDKASLSVSVTDEDKILVKCHAGCEQVEVLRGLESEYGIRASDLGSSGGPRRRVVGEYLYRDGGGNPLFKKIRFEPKDFVIEPSGTDTDAVLYNLPEILSSPQVKTVVWVEGEKAADRLMDEGFLATTLGGASKTPDKAVRVLAGRRVVILPDNDDPGRKHAERVARSLRLSGAQAVRILNLPGLPSKGDVVDWLSCHTVQELSDLIRRSLGTVAFTTMTPTAPEWMWNPRIPASGLTMIFGEAGLGKTTVVLDLISRWTTGKNMPESVGSFSPITVAVFGFEDHPEKVILPRLMAAGADLDRVHLLLPPHPGRAVVPDQLEEMKELCKEIGAGIMVLDNVENSMQTGIDSNQSKSLRAALNPLNDFGIPVIAIHHPKKGWANPREAMSGSQAYTNVARSTLMMIPTGEFDNVAFCAVKNSYAPISQTRTLYYRIGTKDVPGLSSQPVIEWLGGDGMSAQDWADKRSDDSQNRTPLSKNYPPPPETFLPPSAFSEASVGIIHNKLEKSSSIFKENANTEVIDSKGLVPPAVIPSRVVVSGSDDGTAPRRVDPWVQAELEKAIRNGVIDGETQSS